MPTKKPRKRNSNRLTRADMQALSALDHILEEERRLREKYSLPLGFRVPHTTATTIHSCTHCQADIALLIFGDNARDVAGLEAYARMMVEVIQRTNLPTYVIAPPSDPCDLDSPALLLKVYPHQEEPRYTTPLEWEQDVKRLSDAHCGKNQQPLTTLALHGTLQMCNANVLLSDNLNQDSVTRLEEPIMVQAHERQPKTHIDDLQPDWSIKSFKATWQEGTLTAYAYLEAIDDQPARGYVLNCNYSHKQPNRRLSDRQMDAGTTLTSYVRSYMLDAMRRAGWQIVGKQEGTRKDIWQHISRIATSSTSEQDQPRRHDSVTGHKKTVEVKKTSARARAPYTREVRTKVVTFSCSRCQKQVTVEKYPGKIFYCEDCAPVVKKEKTRARVARLRTGKQKVKS